MRVTSDDFLTTDLLDIVWYEQEKLRLIMLDVLGRLVTIQKPDTSAGVYTVPFPSLINIIERNLDRFTEGGYYPLTMEPTVTWKGEFNDLRRLSYLDVNRWFISIELLTELTYSIGFRSLITGNFTTGNDRTRQVIRS